VQGFLDREQAKLRALTDRTSGEDVFELKVAMQAIMMDRVGIFRNGPDLQLAVEGLTELLGRSRNIALGNKSLHSNPELVEAIRVPKMIKLALAVSVGATARTESRGAHSREDCPERNDKDWLKRTLAYWRSENDDLPTLEYEDLDISKMEMPPGSRGYGVDNTIHHPDTEARVKEVERIKESMPGADRFEIQQALMPYDLPEKYRGRNERVGVGYK
jgi:fumarate reductase flavoprotein subunit